MRICLDTNVVLQLFGENPRVGKIRQALYGGQVEMAFSNEMLLEYEEVVCRSLGRMVWQRIRGLFTLLGQRRGNVIHVNPSFRFGVITSDPDDNKFVDCAIAAGADFIVTEDRHFGVLTSAGYRPQPITPQEFVRLCLEPG